MLVSQISIGKINQISNWFSPMNGLVYNEYPDFSVPVCRYTIETGQIPGDGVCV